MSVIFINPSEDGTRNPFLTQKRQEFFENFDTISDDEIIEKYNREVDCKGWASIRGAYLMAMRDQFIKRGFDYSAIGNKEGLKLNQKVRLEDKQIVVIVDETNT